MAMEGLGQNVSCEIGRVLVLLTLVGIFQDVLERSLLSIGCRAAKGRQTGGKSKRGTHDGSDTGTTRGDACTMKRSGRSSQDGRKRLRE